jgi:hypothetical protein
MSPGNPHAVGQPKIKTVQEKPTGRLLDDHPGAENKYHRPANVFQHLAEQGYGANAHGEPK